MTDNTIKLIAGTLLTILFTFSGIIYNGMNNNIKDNRIDIDKLTVEKMDKNEITTKLDRIEGYLMIVSTKSTQNDIYIESVSESLNELKTKPKRRVI